MQGGISLLNALSPISLCLALSLPFLFLPLSLPPSSLPLSLENPEPPHSPRLHCDNSCIHGHCCWTACFACHLSRNEATPADQCPSKAASASDHLPCLKTPTTGCLQALARICNSKQSNDHTGFMTVDSSSCVQVWNHIARLKLIWISWTPVVLLEAARAKKLTPPTSQGPRLASEESSPCKHPLLANKTPKNYLNKLSSLFLRALAFSASSFDFLAPAPLVLFAAAAATTDPIEPVNSASQASTFVLATGSSNQGKHERA